MDFDLGVLRKDLEARIALGSNLYTLEECKVLLKEMNRVACYWQEVELAQLMYLNELHAKVVPGKLVVYQWPPCGVPHIPHAPSHPQMQENPLYKISVVVEELNRSLIRLIDQLWQDRRERLLLAAAILRDIEEVVNLSE